MRVLLILVAVVVLSACGLFGKRRTPPPAPTEIIVTGAPAGSVILVDGSQVGQMTTASDQTQVLRVKAGTHAVAVRVGDRIVYREDTYVDAGEHRTVRVLSGLTP